MAKTAVFVESLSSLWASLQHYEVIIESLLNHY